MEQYDVVVIGAGPAGYVAAIRAAQLGMKTACIEKWISKDGEPVLGGTCLNVGCIPSKALLESSDNYYKLKQNRMARHGIEVESFSLNVPEMIHRKDELVKQLTGGVEFLFKKNNVTWIKGHGKFKSATEIEVLAEDDRHEETTVKADHVIVATGSISRKLPNLEIDGEYIVDSASALDFKEVPPRMGVIGAGVIGLEMGSVWGRLGSDVVLLEAMSEFLFICDQQIATVALREFKKQDLDIRLGVRVRSAVIDAGEVKVEFEDKRGVIQRLVFDKLVVAVGRRPCTTGMDLVSAGLTLDENGFINVDETCMTDIPNIFAVGDVVRGPMLAHKGFEEGVMAAERIAGHMTNINHDTIPWVIYTSPEIAWVGKSEQRLRKLGVPFKTGVFPLKANGRALAIEEPHGLVKMLAHKETDEVLGVHILGPFASELIGEAVIAMEFHACAEDLARTVHAHPTVSEAIHEAALGIGDRTLHI